MSEILTLVRFGNPILREVMPLVEPGDIIGAGVQDLINNIRFTNQEKQYGVGLAAPQVGVRLSLSVIGIKPTPTRPNLDVFDSVIINPSYSGIGRRAGMWEGCQSIGCNASTWEGYGSIGSGEDIVFGKALRYRQIGAEWYDEGGVNHKEILAGFVAHVFQHETDHLNGILFVDRVEDKESYMPIDEYRKRIVERSDD